MENCIFKVWNYKYKQFCPCNIVEKLDDSVVRIHGFAKLKDPITKEVYIEEFDICTFWKNVKSNI